MRPRTTKTSGLGVKMAWTLGIQWLETHDKKQLGGQDNVILGPWQQSALEDALDLKKGRLRIVIKGR